MILVQMTDFFSWFRLYYGPEFVYIGIADWTEENGVELEFIKPGKPMQNGYIERFNRSYREGVLDLYPFNTLAEVQGRTGHWIRNYNEERGHDSLGKLTPKEFRLIQGSMGSDSIDTNKQLYLGLFVRLI